MTLFEFLTYKNIKVDKSLCVTIGTDGLKLDKCSIMSVSVASDKVPVTTFYIGGACPAEVEQYTGVSTEYYREKCKSLDSVIKQVNDIVDVHDTVICYNRRFLTDWTLPCFPLIVEKPYIDIVAYLNMLEYGETLHTEIADLKELDKLLRGVVVGRGKGSFQQYVDRYLGLPTVSNGILLEQKIADLYNLWKVVLHV
jgi:hypothetical protein